MSEANLKRFIFSREVTQLEVREIYAVDEEAAWEEYEKDEEEGWEEVPHRFHVEDPICEESK